MPAVDFHGRCALREQIVAGTTLLSSPKAPPNDLFEHSLRELEDELISNPDRVGGCFRIDGRSREVGSFVNHFRRISRSPTE